MNFDTFMALDSNKVNKTLIIFHVMEILEKSYKKSIETNKIVKFPADIQIQMAKLNSWWTERKINKNIDPEKDKAALFSVISLWEYL